MKIKKLRNIVQHYPWGTADFIPGLLGIDNIDGKPFAELWMGTHPRGESVFEEDGTPVSSVIRESPYSALGKKTADIFKDTLPFLFKVLSAGSPLSIQAHPDKKQAEEGFERENKEGIPLDAFNRNYRDDNHKPEIICALTPFTAMCGFRDPDEIKSVFNSTGSVIFRKYLLPVLSADGGAGKGELLKNFFSAYMRLEKSVITELIEEVLLWAEEDSGVEADLVRKFVPLYPGDPGVLSPLFLNVFKLDPGEALFQGPGELHAYIEGTGIELMANSDNVLRGGMTSKNVDLDELLKILDFGAEKPEIITGGELEKCIFSYDTPAREFRLERAELNGNCGNIRRNPVSAEILLCTSGTGEIGYSEGALGFSKGDSFFIPFSVNEYYLKGEGECFISSVPVENHVGGKS